MALRRRTKGLLGLAVAIVLGHLFDDPLYRQIATWRGDAVSQETLDTLAQKCEGDAYVVTDPVSKKTLNYFPSQDAFAVMHPMNGESIYRDSALDIEASVSYDGDGFVDQTILAYSDGVQIHQWPQDLVLLAHNSYRLVSETPDANDLSFFRTGAEIGSYSFAAQRRFAQDLRYFAGVDFTCSDASSTEPINPFDLSIGTTPGTPQY